MSLTLHLSFSGRLGCCLFLGGGSVLVDLLLNVRSISLLFVDVLW